jgi:hypothetical protein
MIHNETINLFTSFYLFHSIYKIFENSLKLHNDRYWRCINTKDARFKSSLGINKAIKRENKHIRYDEKYTF